MRIAAATRMPTWLEMLATLSLVVAVASASIIVTDILSGRRQHMWIMNVVWPVTALWSGPLGLWAYFRWGRAGTQEAMTQAKQRGAPPPSKQQPFPVLVAKATSHCGSGCTLGDIVAEGFAVAVPFSLFGYTLFGGWVYDYAAAYALGIVFQYFTIKPMRDISRKEALVDAIKADTLSLTAWQVGMYGWMAITRFVLFGHDIEKGSPVFWFMMQIAMFLGFATSYPVNWWLLRRGIKEKM
jgi:hypothetical protein